MDPYGIETSRVQVWIKMRIVNMNACTKYEKKKKKRIGTKAFNYGMKDHMN